MLICRRSPLAMALRRRGELRATVADSGTSSLHVSGLDDGELACVAGRFELPQGDWQLQFRWRVASAASTSGLGFYDGVRLRASAAVGDWDLQRYDFQGGEAKLFRWCQNKIGAGSESGWIDNLSLVSLQLDDKAAFCDALDIGADTCAMFAPALPEESTPWRKVPVDDAFQGASMLRSVWLATPGESCLSARLAGVSTETRRLRFRWRAPRLQTGKFSFRVDGFEELDFAQPEEQWTQLDYLFNAPGDYTLRWCAQRRNPAGSVEDVFDEIQIDALELLAGEEFSPGKSDVCRALDLDAAGCATIEDFKFLPNSFVWSSGANSVAEGGRALQLPRKRRGHFDACLRLGVTAPNDSLRVLVDWRDGDIGSKNAFRFSVDDVELERLSHSDGWVSLNHPLMPGYHRLELCHDKRSGVFGNAGFESQLDNLRLVTSADLPASMRTDFCAALDLPIDDCPLVGEPMSMPASLPWSRYARTGARGASVLSVAQVARGSTSAVEVDIEVGVDSWLSFSWQLQTEAMQGRLRLLVDGVERARAPEDGVSAVARIPLDVGSHRLRWEYGNKSVLARDENHFWIDGLSLFPRDLRAAASKDDICAALGIDAAVCADIDSYEFENGDWEFAFDDSIEISQLTPNDGAGGVSLRLRLDQPEEEACLHLNYAGDADIASLRRKRVSFEWKARNTSDSLSFRLDGVAPTGQGSGARVSAGGTGWALGRITLNSPGPHRLSWCLERGAGAADGSYHAIVDNVRIENSPQTLLPLGAVCFSLLDSESLCPQVRRVFYTPDPLRWVNASSPTRTLSDGGTDFSHLSVGADTANAVAAGASSCLSLDVDIEQGRETVGFHWRLDTGGSIGFEVDGSEVARLGEASDWAEVGYELSEAGAHRLRWCYSASAMRGAARLDGLIFRAAMDDGGGMSTETRHVYNLVAERDYIEIDRFGDIEGSVTVYLEVRDGAGVALGENPGFQVEFRLSALYTRFEVSLGAWVPSRYIGRIDDNYELDSSAPTQNQTVELQAWVDGEMVAAIPFTIRLPAQPARYALRAVDATSSEPLTALPVSNQPYIFHLYVDVFDAQDNLIDNPKSLFLRFTPAGGLIPSQITFKSVGARTSRQPQNISVTLSPVDSSLMIKLLDGSGGDTLGDVTLTLIAGAMPSTPTGGPPAIAGLRLEPASVTLFQMQPGETLTTTLLLTVVDENGAPAAAEGVAFEVNADGGADVSALETLEAVAKEGAQLRLRITPMSGVDAVVSVGAYLVADAEIRATATITASAAPRVASALNLMADTDAIVLEAAAQETTLRFTLSGMDNYGDGLEVELALEAGAGAHARLRGAARRSVSATPIEILAIAGLSADAAASVTLTATASLGGVTLAQSASVALSRKPPPAIAGLRLEPASVTLLQMQPGEDIDDDIAFDGRG